MIVKIEKWLAGVFKNTPRLSAENKKLVVQVLPWIALVFGALQLLSALGLWNWLQEAQKWGLFSNAFVGYRVSQFDIVMVYVSLGLLVLMAMLLLAAYSPLRARARRGWELFLVVGMVNIVSGLVALFVSGRGISSSVFSMLTAAAIFYLLVQVRDMYKGKGLEVKTEDTKKSKRSDHSKK